MNRRIAIVVAFASLTTAAMGCADQETGELFGPHPSEQLPPNTPPSEACASYYCPAAAAGDGCDAEAVEYVCVESCLSAKLSSMDVDPCAAEIASAFFCMRDATFECDGTETYYGVDWPVVVEDSCRAELDAVYACDDLNR